MRAAIKKSGIPREEIFLSYRPKHGGVVCKDGRRAKETAWLYKGREELVKESKPLKNEGLAHFALSNLTDIPEK